MDFQGLVLVWPDYTPLAKCEELDTELAKVLDVKVVKHLHQT